MFESWTPQTGAPEAPQNLHELRTDLVDIEDVLGELDATAARYEEATENLRQGDDADIEWLEAMQVTLVDFSKKLATISNITPQTEEVRSLVLSRLSDLSELLEMQNFAEEGDKTLH